MYGLPVFDDRCMKIKIRTYAEKFYTNFRGLNMPEDGAKCESLANIIESLLVYENNYYMQVYLDNCAYKIVDK